LNLLHRLFFELFYFRKPPWDTGITPPELEAFIQSHHAGRALDLGCGTGTNAIYMAQKGWEVTGVDFVGRAIHSARIKAQRAGVRVDFRREDVTRLRGIQASFDLILDIGCFHTLTAEGRLRCVKNLERLLATCGTYLLYAFGRDTQNSNQGLYPEDLMRLEEMFRHIKREDGSDQGRASAWLTFQRESIPSIGERKPR